MILVIDNYDSFTYNLVHYLNELGAETAVYRNDALTAQDALAMRPEAVVLSPGPCTPNEAGICLALIAGAPLISARQMPASLGVQGPGESTTASGRIANASCAVSASLR